MISYELQKRIHNGERDAFAALYAQYSRGVYRAAYRALGSENDAREVVKCVFLAVYRELRSAEGPIDTDARVEALAGGILREKLAASGRGTTYAVHTPRRIDRQAPSEKPKADALTRVQARMTRSGADTGDELFDSGSRQPARGNALMSVCVGVFSVLFIWLLLGILMEQNVLPRLNLGYEWFDRNIFNLFGI